MGLKESPSGQPVPFGLATLVAGAVTVTGVRIADAESRVLISRETPGGALGNLSVANIDPAAGSFDINSDSGTETSTVAFCVLNQR